VLFGKQVVIIHQASFALLHRLTCLVSLRPFENDVRRIIPSGKLRVKCAMDGQHKDGVSSSLNPITYAAVVNAGTQEAAREDIVDTMSADQNISQTQLAMMVAFQKDPGEDDHLLLAATGANDAKGNSPLHQHNSAEADKGFTVESHSNSFQHVFEVHPYLRFGGVCMLGLVVISYARDGGIFDFARHPELAWKIALGKSGELLVALACILLPVSHKAVRRRYYDIMMTLVLAMCLALHVHATVRSSLSDGTLRFLSPGLLLSLLMLFTMFNSWLGFRPWRIMYVIEGSLSLTLCWLMIFTLQVVSGCRIRSSCGGTAHPVHANGNVGF
jgi:hypothetical protein